MKQKILLLSEARHGTTYVISEIEVASLSYLDSTVCCYEFLSRSKDQNAQCLKCLERLEADTDFCHVRHKYPIKFFNLFMDAVDNSPCDNFFSKVFASQIFPNTPTDQPMKLDLALERFDKIIILDRNPIEYIFSHANAFYFPCGKNPWGIKQRHQKQSDIKLNQGMIDAYKTILSTKDKCFRQTRRYCKKNNKPLLDIQYDELADVHEKFFNFTGLKAKVFKKFEPIKHDYETFLKLNPSVHDLF